jgi:sugar lactone lactonase YvrE
MTDPVAYHGEGPGWSERWGGLRWVDMLAGDVLSLAADGTINRRHVGSVAAALRPRSRGGAVIGVERGFALEDADGTITHLPEVWSDPQVRMNEGGGDPDGRFLCGSMAYDQRPGAAALYRLDPDGSVRVVLRNVTISNGIEWSPDGARVYYNDTATFQISVFDYDTDAGLTNRRVFVDLSAEGKRPDGLTVDAQGGVWVALSNGSAVRRYTPDGVGGSWGITFCIAFCTTTCALNDTINGPPCATVGGHAAARAEHKQAAPARPHCATHAQAAENACWGGYWSFIPRHG